jgi:hypothetical protein
LAGELSAKVLRNGKTVPLAIKVGDQPDEMRFADQPRKQYEGQKAPFNFGFRIADYTPQLGQEYGIPPLRQPGPVVIEVDEGGCCDDEWA